MKFPILQNFKDLARTSGGGELPLRNGVGTAILVSAHLCSVRSTKSYLSPHGNVSVAVCSEPLTSDPRRPEALVQTG